MILLGNYVIQRETVTDSKGHKHNRRLCTMPSFATQDMGVDSGDADARTVSIYYDDAEEKIIIEKKK